MYIAHQMATATGNTTALADKLTLVVDRPIKVIRWGFIATTTLNDTAATFALDFQPTAGSASGRVDAWGGAITAGVAIAGGSGQMHTLTTGEGARPTATSGTLPESMVIPGEAVIIQLTAKTSSAGAGTYFIEYEPLSNSQYSYVVTGTYGNMTEKAS